ncbi:hypothetical protein BJ878DRAFT_579589 [Calycina marina]|uniref:Uncharacterized protein n=1 Tax=Calycina marina TaxID=1763456 RepID=A0A9P8CJG6_9HELO|nr:hypothetical protein BJ878DRAFT_579589 [Calycina marina]
MGLEPPFLYNPVKTGEGPRNPYHSFDPKAVSRTSLQPKAPRPKQNGPLVSFNQHPDSYFFVPTGRNGINPMRASVKSWIKWARICQLILRCLELIVSCGLLVMMILIRNVDATTGWIMRIVPGVAILHTVYGIYHLGRKASGRTPASSASYMMFAAFFDVSIIPFYTFSALVAKTKQAAWTNVVNEADRTQFSTVVFYLSAAGGVMYLASLILSIYLAVVFRKIVRLPPDMNPLEDHLTSRHKRNKTSISTMTLDSKKRISIPLESKRSSGAIYEDLNRPPSIPFFHTRIGSTDSFSTYKSTPSPLRDSHLDLPNRQYQIPSSPRSSVDSDMKCALYYGGAQTSSPKLGAYTGVPLSDTASQRSGCQIAPAPRSKNAETTWYTRDSLSKRDSLLSNEPSRSESPQKGYQPVHQPYNSSDAIDLPNPLESNPPTPLHNHFSSHGSPNGPPNSKPPTSRHSYRPNSDSPLAEISNNRNGTDIADLGDGFKAKLYEELRPGTPPVIVGKNRQVSSGTDFQNLGGYKVDRRDVSGKIAEEGRGGAGNGSGWGTRFRKVSGL